MSVIPQDTETALIVAGGFRLVDGPFEHRYFGAGYGAVYTADGTAKSSTTPNHNPHSAHNATG